MVCEGNAVSPVDAQRTVACKYSRAGQIVARTANGVRQTYEYDKKGQLLAVKDADGNAVERYAYDKAGDMLKKTLRIGRGDSPSRRQYQTTTFTFDAANQLVSSTTDGVTTRYAYDAAGRMVREGNKTYRYGYLDKVMSVSDGDTTRTFTYHADGQLARANYGDSSESFAWDGLALIQRGDEQFINEPHVGGGNPIASSKGTSYFNDALGTTVGSKSNGKYSAAALTAFGENVSVDSPTPTQNSNFFTGKPYVEGLGHAFWMRNYRAGLAKWQTADPMGYPDGWNQLAYCGNGVTSAVDIFGGELKVIGHTTEEAPMVTNDMGTHVHIDDDGNGHDCHWYRFDFYEYKVTIMQDFIKKRRWELVDGWENVLNGFGYGCDISGGYLALTGVGTAPGAGFLFAGILFHTAAGLVDYLNYWVEVPNGEPIRVRDTTPTYIGSVEGHAYE